MNRYNAVSHPSPCMSCSFAVHQFLGVTPAPPRQSPAASPASERHPVLLQLVSAHTELDYSSQLCQALCGQLVFKREKLCTHLSCKKAHFKTARGGSGPEGADSVHANAGGARDTELPGAGIERFGGRSPMQSKAPARGTNSIQSYFPVQSLHHISMRVISAPL